MDKRSTSRILIVAAMVVVALGAQANGSTFDGTIKLGGIGIDEDYGDLSSLQETYNIYDGFNVSQIRLNANINPRNYFTLNLREINLKSRKGDFLYRMPGVLKISSRYVRDRWVFDPDRVVNTDRKHWRIGVGYTPRKSWTLSANYNINKRNGDRLSYPTGTQSWLGNGYDYTIQTGGIEARYIRGRRGAAVRYDLTDFTNRLDGDTDRRGYVVSARVHSPCGFYDKWTHFLRGAYGRHELSTTGLDYTLMNFQYTGVVAPINWFTFKYNLYLNRIDDESTQMKTDNVQNNFDGEFYYRYGRLFAGYGYEINDDDRSLTNYNTYRVGGTFDYEGRVFGKVRYANRSKTDTEKRTLLQDIDSELIRADLKLKVIKDLTVGGKYIDGEREFTDIGVKSEGEKANAYLVYEYPNWAGVQGDYTYGVDRYVDRVGKFDTDSHVVTAKLTIDRIRNLYLAGGVTYLQIGKDLDIEKSILSFEGEYTIADDYHIEVQYNVYNYDDFLVLERYYTANVVWVNVAYDFGIKSSD
jgi:hypothetical protein